MITIANRINLMVQLGAYMLSDDNNWLEARRRAASMNPWFTEEYIELSVQNIASAFLSEDKLNEWMGSYKLPDDAKTVGIVMAGNIPLVGFHDFLCAFLSGQRMMLKLSSKDEVLLGHLIDKLIEWQLEIAEQIIISEMLKGCDAYIATGSNNSARYFEQYFDKYPHIIRRNRTSVAVLTGNETEEELQSLSKDVFTYFGLGCRNVTQINVPRDYDFSKLLEVFRNHDAMILHNKYKNNYDYHLALYLLNKVPYLSNDSILLIENAFPFSAVSVLHYQYYDDSNELLKSFEENEDIQCVVGKNATPFGKAQQPSLGDYPDGIDTMAFLCSL